MDDPRRLAEIDALFDRALELDGDERRRCLDGIQDAEVRRTVHELLELTESEATTDPVWKAAEEGRRHAIEAAADEEETGPGDRLGVFRLVREIGRGGMGVVYLAERDDGQFDQRVALKLVRSGLLDEAARGRFLRERQILAHLTHPAIARLVDGGVEGGRAWLAMEWVDGEPIDRSCDQRQLSIDERIRLFVEVARAVHHAHRSLVIHRDLKPSNVLVDAEGRVKLLDFGIAKPLSEEGDGSISQTQAGLLPLTPEYASPEQLRGEPVTTSSDVFQLGLLLFELVTGRRLRDGPRAAREALVEAAHRARPPTASSSLPDDEAIAACRSSTPTRLRRRIRGDLDRVVARALDPEPEARYGTPEDLARDLERFLEGRPVEAGSGSWADRTVKLIRRHPFGTAAVVLILVLVVGSFLTITEQNRRIAAERDRARLEAVRAVQVHEVLSELFAEIDPYRRGGDGMSARGLLDQGSQRVRTELDGQPDLQADLLGLLGQLAQGIGDYQGARPLLEEALALERSLGSSDRPGLARSLRRIGGLYVDLGELDDAKPLLAEGLAMAERLWKDEPLEVAESLSVTCNLARSRGDAAASATCYREVLAMIQGAWPAPEATRIAAAKNDLAVALEATGDRTQAEELHRQALETRRRLLGEDHPATSESLNNLAVLVRRRGDDAEAEALYREALEIRRRVFGLRHTRVANTLNNLGEALRRQGRLDEAGDAHREALEIRREALGEEHHNTAMSLHNLGVVARDAGDLQVARTSLETALGTFRRTLSPRHRLASYSLIALGQVALREGDDEDAESRFREALSIRRESWSPGSDRIAEAELWLARSLAGRAPDEARELATSARTTLEATPDANPALMEELETTEAALAPRGDDR